MMLRFRRPIAAWIALLSMALNALWPLLANAQPPAPADPSEICSATGMKHLGGEPDGVPGKGVHPSHCTLCPFNAERGAAVLPPSLPIVAASCATDPRPEFSGTARLESPLGLSALPRAPPHSS